MHEEDHVADYCRVWASPEGGFIQSDRSGIGDRDLSSAQQSVACHLELIREPSPPQQEKYKKGKVRVRT